MKKIIMLFLTILGGLLVGVVPVFADDYDDLDITMTVSPPQQRIVLIPGEIYEGAIRVSNSKESKRI